MAIIVLVSSAILLITFLSPRIGLYFFWTFWLCYPTTALHNILPLSTRFDDVFLVFLFLVCIRFAPPDVLSTRSFRICALWYSAEVFGIIMGIFTGPPDIIPAEIRSLGKAAYGPLLVYILHSVVRDERDLRRQIIAFGIGVIGMTTIAMVQLQRPDLTVAWEMPSIDVDIRTASEAAEASGGVSETARAGGSTGTTVLAAIGVFSAIVGLRCMLNVPKLTSRLGYAVMTFAGGLSLAYSVTRSAAAGMLAALLYSVFRFRKSAVMVVILVIAVVSALAFTDLAERWSRRVEGQGISDPLGESAELRSALWKIYIDEFSPHYLLFGRSNIAEFNRHAAGAHNTYIAAFAYTGLYGAIVQTMLVITALRLGSRLAREADSPFARALGESLVMVFVALIVHGVASDVLQNPLAQQMSLIAMVDIALREHERQQADMQTYRQFASVAASQAPAYQVTPPSLPA